MIKFSGIFVVFFCIVCLVQGVFAATYTVTKTADSNDGACDSDCSLREAIAAANAAATDDIIAFDAVLFSTPQIVNVTIGEIVIANNGSLTINGTGVHQLTIDGNNSGRIITNNTGAVAVINDATFTHGTGAGTANTGRGGAIYNNGGDLTLNNLIITANSGNTGGGTNNAGTGSVMTVNNCVISNNTSVSSGGGMQNFSTSTLNISNSTISGNTSGGSTGGGALQANGTVRITNSTITGNNAPGGSGGGIAYNGTSLILTNVTISGNTSTSNGGGIHKSTSTLNAFIRNSIFAGNIGAAASPDITGAFGSEGNNIIANIGTSTGWVASDLQNTNPLLSPLGFYGGEGLTYLPLNGSPTIDAGQNCVTDLSCATNNPPVAVTTDQRGAARPSNSTVDIGAVEVSSSYTATLPEAHVGQSYNFTIVPDNGAFSYSVTGGSLPSGLNLTTAFTGYVKNLAPEAVVSVAGTPTQGGQFNFAVTLTDGTNSAVVNYQINSLSNSATATVGGVVSLSSGRAVSNAVVVATDQGGNPKIVRTNGFGRFYFEGLTIGQTYTFTVSSKEAVYQPQMIMIVGDTNNLTFTPSP